MDKGIVGGLIAQEVLNRNIKSYQLEHEVFSNIDHIEVKNNELLFIHYLNVIGGEDAIVKLESANHFEVKNKSNMRVFFIDQTNVDPLFYLESYRVTMHQGLIKVNAKLTNNFFLLAIRLKVLDHEKSEELHSA